MNDLIQDAIDNISKNHHQIIDDWCKAYMAELYEAGVELKPGCFTLVEQLDFELKNGKIENKYWFKPKTEQETNNERLLNQLTKIMFDLKDYVNEQIERIQKTSPDQFEAILVLKQAQNMLCFLDETD